MCAARAGVTFVAAFASRIMTLSLSAIVLAAGRSTRMGWDKAALDLDGAPLWRRQCAVLTAAGATELFVSARPEQPWVRDARTIATVVHDALPDCGPLVGLTAGLERASQSLLAVLAVDLPHLPPSWFASLAREASPDVGVVGRGGAGFEPLAAIYPREFRWLAWEAIARGEYALQPLVARAAAAGLLRVRAIGPDEAAWFKNWNRLEDRE